MASPARNVTRAPDRTSSAPTSPPTPPGPSTATSRPSRPLRPSVVSVTVVLSSCRRVAPVVVPARAGAPPSGRGNLDPTHGDRPRRGRRRAR
ncbi:Uncharacterised protein [Mycobacteroides abscessus]|nr:Uncharacterised protein [Mycobacteroides abscessus]